MRRRLWWRLAGIPIAGLGLAALPLGIGVPAYALDACTARTLSQPFKQWGDSNNYFPVSSGTFGSGTSGRSIGSGVSRVAENEPWKVAGNGANSLRLAAGSSVSTPEMCLTAAEDSTRFFYKSPGNGSGLQVTIKATNPAGERIYMVSFTLPAGGGARWRGSPPGAPPGVSGAPGA